MLSFSKYNRKYIEIYLIVLFSIICFSTLAQDKKERNSHEERAELQANYIANELNLSDLQTKQLYILILDRSIEMMNARELNDKSRIIEAENEYNKKFLNLLNKDQIKRHEEIEEEKRRNPPHE